MWRSGGKDRQKQRKSVESAVWDCCEYGARYLKPTELRGTLPGLHLLSRRCRGGHFHERLQGTVQMCGIRTWRTSLSGKYAPLLCQKRAAVLSDAAERTCFARDSREVQVGMDRLERDLCSCVGGKPAQFFPSCGRSATREWPLDAPEWGGIRKWVARKIDS